MQVTGGTSSETRTLHCRWVVLARLAFLVADWPEPATNERLPDASSRNLNTKLPRHASRALVLIGRRACFVVAVDSVDNVDGESLGSFEPCIAAGSDGPTRV